MVDQGISTLLTNTDLIETAAGMVVFDERITLGELWTSVNLLLTLNLIM